MANSLPIQKMYDLENVVPTLMSLIFIGSTFRGFSDSTTKVELFIKNRKNVEILKERSTL